MKMTMKRTRILLAALVMMFCFSATAYAKYVSLKTVGLTDFQNMTKFRIVSVNGNTVRYRKVKIGSKNGDVDITFGKIKTAKLTKKTKYYVGSVNRYNKTFTKGASTAFLDKKWIKRVSKSKFKKVLTGKEWWDVVVVKKGKVVKIFTKMQLAG